MKVASGRIGDAATVVRSLEGAKPLYMLPRDDFVSVLVPTIGASRTFDCMMGFFASSSLAQIAPGLAAFLRQSIGTVRILVSPVISDVDQQALRLGLLDEHALTDRFLDGLPDADDLVRHTLDCLSWLVRKGRLELRFAILREGIFHPKVWLLDVQGHRVAFHGSSNMTGSGLGRNREQIAVARSWMDDVQRETEARVRDEFGELWDGDDPDVFVAKLPQALKDRLLRDYGKGSMPSEEDAERLWQQARAGTNGDVGIAAEPEARADTCADRRFHPPSWLRYRDGAFSHQGRAIDAWLAAGRRGILAMATGSGKTLTSLAACHELRRDGRQLLIVVAAPYVPLLMQWCDEVRLFGIEPRNLSDAGGPAGRRREVAEAARSLSLGLSTVEALVVSHDTLSDPGFQASLTRIRCEKVLIADEMHNLGTTSFLRSPPDMFEHRLGLSATPVRQYDPEGTDKLFSFFGQPCFEFSLEEAIGVCLVPYDYHVHPIELAHDEMDEFKNLTEKIRQLAWKFEGGNSDPQLDDLLRRRRLVVETASGKIAALEAVLRREGGDELRYELIYATDKAPAQLEQVNAMLARRGVLFHQLTADETRDRKRTAQIIEGFRNGELQVLTAKRVLDEGVNVPEIRRAFILASTTVERQWVQRRGRILRRCDAIGKEHGIIHDFVAMPPAELVMDVDARNLVRGELKRVEEFARLARNYGAADGPLRVLQSMQTVAYV